MSENPPNTGYYVSATVHAALLVVALVGFADAKKFDDAQESVPVEMVTQQQLNEIMKGDKTAKEAKPAPKAQKVADVAETKPDSPTPEAKVDVPVPPLRPRLPDPGEAEIPEPPKPVRVAVVAPEPPEPPKPVRVAVASPEPPVPPRVQPRPEPVKPPPPKVEAKPPPPQKSEIKPPPPDIPDAEPIVPEPPKKPVVKAVADTPEPPKKVRPAPKQPDPPPVPEKPKLAEKPPEPVKVAEKPKLDQIAKVLADAKAKEVAKPDDKPVPKPKTAEPVADAKPRPDFNAIANLLRSKDAAQQKASSARAANQTASIGAPTASAARMSPTMSDQFNGLVREHYRQCWNQGNLDPGQSYAARIAVHFNPDGSLNGAPVLRNPSADPQARSIGESALRAIRSCGPVPVPASLAPFYNEWKDGILVMKPGET